MKSYIEVLARHCCITPQDLRYLRLILIVLAGLEPSVLAQAIPLRPAVTAPAPELRRIEIGANFNDIQFAPCGIGDSGCVSTPQFALGPGLALNLNRHLAIDAAFNPLLSRQEIQNTANGGRGSEILIGIRSEAHAKNFGLFAYARPGLAHWTNVVSGWKATESNGSVQVTLEHSQETYFVTNVGGGVEFFPLAHIQVRAEMGDLVMHGRAEWREDWLTWTNNLQTSVGAYMGMGKMLPGRPFDAGHAPAHRFFDKTNLLLMTISLLGQSADDITTQRFRKHGIKEVDPLARPFVNRGWVGQIGLAAIENTTEVSVMYALHKMGHHRIERIIPIAPAIAGAFEGYHTLQGE